MPTEPYQPVDYLVIGHITQDLTPSGSTLGGTVSYAARTAHVLGLRVGIVTALPEGIGLEGLNHVSIHRIPCEHATTFENIQTPEGRLQFIHHHAPSLTFEDIPLAWRQAPVVHLGPVAREVSPGLASSFPGALVGFTPQGWLRDWNGAGRVEFRHWPEADEIIRMAGATVLSIEDLHHDEEEVENLLQLTSLLIVTEGAKGGRIYWNGDVRRFNAIKQTEVDTTGAGDIFATAFFCRLHLTHDPWEAARFAAILASHSVTRPGLLGVPTPEEVEAARVEILDKH